MAISGSLLTICNYKNAAAIPGVSYMMSNRMLLYCIRVISILDMHRKCRGPSKALTCMVEVLKTIWSLYIDARVCVRCLFPLCLQFAMMIQMLGCIALVDSIASVNKSPMYAS